MKNFCSKSTFALPFFIALSSLALVGCGDDDDGSPTAGSSGKGGQGGSSTGGSGGSGGSAGSSPGGSSGSGGSAGGGDAGTAGSGGSNTGGSGGGGGSAGSGAGGGGGTGGSGTGGSSTAGSGTGGGGTGGSGTGGSGTGGSGTGGSGTGGSGGGGTGGTGGGGTGGSGGGGTVIDTSFGDNGFFHFTKSSEFDFVQSIHISEGGSLDVFVTSNLEGGTIVRLLADGTLDGGFGKGGIAAITPTLTWFASDIAELPGGGIMLSGVDIGGELVHPVFARLKADGTLDASFGDGGFRPIDVGGFEGRIRSIVQHEGRTLGVGSGGPGLGYNALAVRLLPDGTLDTSFSAPDGFDFYTTDVPADFTNDDFWESYAAADGSLYACGLDLTFPDGQTPDFNFLVARYTPDGTLDPNFGEGGVVNLDVHGQSGGSPVRDNFCAGITEAPGGKIVFIGDVMHELFTTQANVAIVRLLPDGTPDPSFGQNGVVQLDQDTYDRPTGVVALPDGRVVVSGYVGTFFETSPFVLVLRADGTPDPSFADGGRFVFDLSGEHFSDLTIARQSDGKLVVAGTYPSHFVARLNAP